MAQHLLQAGRRQAGAAYWSTTFRLDGVSLREEARLEELRGSGREDVTIRRLLGFVALVCVCAGCASVRSRMDHARAEGCQSIVAEYDSLAGDGAYAALRVDLRREFEREVVTCLMTPGYEAAVRKIIAGWTDPESLSYRLFTEARLAAREGNEPKCRAACESLESVGLRFFVNYVVRQPELEKYRGAKWLRVAALRSISPNTPGQRLQQDMADLAAAVGSDLVDVEEAALVPATPAGGLVLWSGEVREIQPDPEAGVVRILLEAVDLKSEVVARERQALSTHTSGSGSIYSSTVATSTGSHTAGTVSVSTNTAVEAFVVTDRVKDSFVHKGKLFVLRIRNVSSAVLKLKSLVVAGLYAGRAGSEWTNQQNLPLVEAHMLSPREESERVEERLERTQ